MPLRTADTIETFWDARIDLLERRIKKHSDRFKAKAGEAIKRAGTPTTDLYTKDMEKEVQRFKEKVRSSDNCTRQLSLKPPIDDDENEWPCKRMAIHQGRPYSREDLILLRGHVCRRHLSPFRHGPGMDTRLFHATSLLLLPCALLHLQEEAVALFPLRPVLLCQHSQPAVYLGLPQQRISLCSLLLSCSW